MTLAIMKKVGDLFFFRSLSAWRSVNQDVVPQTNKCPAVFSPILFAFALLVSFVISFIVLPAQSAHAEELVPEWGKSYGGNIHDSFNGLLVLGNGNVVAVGYSGSTTSPYWGNEGEDDAIAVCFDEDGNVVWSHNYGGYGSEGFTSLVEVGECLYVAGYSTSVSSSPFSESGWGNVGDNDGILVKINSSTGEAVWGVNYGGDNEDRFEALVHIDGFLYAAGYSAEPSTTIGSGNDWGNVRYNDAILVKADIATGAAVWGVNYGSAEDDSFHALVFVDNFLYAAGSSESASTNLAQGNWGNVNSGSSDGILVKIDPANGAASWGKNYGGMAYDHFYDLVFLEGCFFAVGESEGTSTNIAGGNWGNVNSGSSDGILVKIDPNGVALWGNNYGGTDYDYLEALVATGGFLYAAGYSDDVSTNIAGGNWGNVGQQDAVLVKIDPSNGVAQWGRNFGGPSTEYLFALVVAGDSLFLAGYSTGASTNLDPGANWPTPQSPYNAILIKLTTTTSPTPPPVPPGDNEVDGGLAPTSDSSAAGLTALLCAVLGCLILRVAYFRRTS